jgi:hypothetical protein
MKMSDSIFGALDIESAQNDPFKVDDGTYHATVTGAKVAPTNAGDKIGLTITYKITDEGDMEGKDVKEWQNIPQPADPQNPTTEEKRSASYLKARLLALGVPADGMNKMQPEDLLGTDVIITVAEKDGYTNIKKLVLDMVLDTGADW